ncbi:uncharacterized protein LOC122134495 [Cyprinus carpio]|uniref:Uncharacterized protein LOC122134495 n=1 Tax=Cyprinus carpio TaxID=7962 RepID=A0A9Q9VZ25_CYPCA|nr:uncharacterized protein LOC122134495 [Cyprinus carpio]XP_042573821.1 uncharacterized protein LOC122134495 [Cyprinus carpio]XP_042573829.1 uncharacterized protein LOC122134495 [Cyprinus carpio]
MKQQVIFLKELERLKRSSSMEQETGVETSSEIQMHHTQQKCCEPWPAVFSLPDFPPELNESLQRKDPSFKKKEKSHLRSLLIQVLFDSITKYTWYPSHKIYTDVLGSLIKRFPFLKDTSPSGHDTLLHCLRNKFKKERIPLVHSSAVQEMKKKFGVKRNALDISVSDGLVSEEEQTKRCKTANFPVLLCTDNPVSTQSQEIILNLENIGEDQLSFQEHITVINAELRKR